MNRTHFVLLAAALASGLVIVATAGAPIEGLASGDGIDVIGPDEEADATGHLELEPHDGPNGKYALLNDDGEIEITIDASNPNLEGHGVNVEAGTTIHDVFTVTYNASTIENNTPVKVWLEHGDDPDTDIAESDLLTFTSDGQPIEGEHANITLSPNETASVGLSVDSTDAEPGLVTSNFTIRAEFPTEPEVDDQAVTTATRTSFAFTSTAPNLCEGTVYNARGGETTRIDACSVEIADGITLESASFRTPTDDTVDVRLEGSPTQFPDRPALDPAATGVVPLGHFTAEYEPRGGDPTELADVSYDVVVSPERLATPGIETPGTVREPGTIDELDPASIRLYGFDPGNESWISLNTSVVETTEKGVLLRTDSDRFPVYTVGVDAPVLHFEETTLHQSAVAVNETATITATLANDGLAEGDAQLTLRANGEVIATTTAAVPAGNRTVVTFERAFDEPGVYEITVDGEVVGELTVEAPDTEDPLTEEPSETEEPSVTTPELEDSEETPEPEDSEETPELEDAPPEIDELFDQVEEPAGIDLGRTVGLVSFLVIVLSTGYLVRRMPRR